MAAPTYYEASAPAPPARPALTRPAAADACVVGGGLTGLSAAIALAEAGASVVLLEAGRIGDGASGRSGGQLIPGFRHGAVELVRRFGAERAQRLVALTVAAMARTAALAVTAPVEFKPAGHVTAAVRARDLEWMEAEARALAALGYPHAGVLERAALGAQVGSDLYHGGLLDAGGGHVHPLKLVRALADRAAGAGVKLHERSPARAVSAGDRPLVRTDAAEVAADAVVLACDAMVGGVDVPERLSGLGRRMMPVWSYGVATAPLGERQANALLPGDAAVSDTRFALDYFRLSVDRRLLFSGGERYVLSPIADVPRFVRPYLARVFPALRDVAIDFGWAGTVAVTTSRYPHAGRDGPVWFAHGYSGHGMLLAQAAGRAIGAAIAGDTEDFSLLAALPTRVWPGGPALRHPLYTAGMLWLSLKDRLP